MRALAKRQRRGNLCGLAPPVSTATAAAWPLPLPTLQLHPPPLLLLLGNMHCCLGVCAEPLLSQPAAPTKAGAGSEAAMAPACPGPAYQRQPPALMLMCAAQIPLPPWLLLLV
jgi:hypothetical protein